MKYFLLGAFSSGILLYGMSVLYGVTGSTNLGDIGKRVGEALSLVQGGNPPDDRRTQAVADSRHDRRWPRVCSSKLPPCRFTCGRPMLTKARQPRSPRFFPPDQRPRASRFSRASFSIALGPMQVDWAPLLGIVAAMTIVVGNWAAITQENSKRLLAYSSISNAGYLLLGLVANNIYGNIGLVIYLLVYTLMNMGAFGVIISLRRRGIIGDNVDDMTGLAQKAPGMAAMMAIFMLSLGGLPVTGGFIGKYFLLWRFASARRRGR